MRRDQRRLTSSATLPPFGTFATPPTTINSTAQNMMTCTSRLLIGRARPHLPTGNRPHPQRISQTPAVLQTTGCEFLRNRDKDGGGGLGNKL